MEHFVFRELAMLLIRDNDIAEMSIQSTKITGQHAKHIAGALKRPNCKLTQLDMTYTKLTDEGAECLSDALKSGTVNLLN